MESSFNGSICGVGEHNELTNALEAVCEDNKWVNCKTCEIKTINYGFVYKISCQGTYFWVKVFLNFRGAENSIKNEKGVLEILEREKIPFIVPYRFYDDETFINVLKGKFQTQLKEEVLKKLQNSQDLQNMYENSEILAYMISPHVSSVRINRDFSKMFKSFFMMQMRLKEKKLMYYDIHDGNVRMYNNKFIFIDLGGICSEKSPKKEVSCNGKKSYYKKNNKLDTNIEKRTIFSTFFTAVSFFVQFLINEKTNIDITNNTNEKFLNFKQELHIKTYSIKALNNDRYKNFFTWLRKIQKKEEFDKDQKFAIEDIIKDLKNIKDEYLKLRSDFLKKWVKSHRHNDADNSDNNSIIQWHYLLLQMIWKLDFDHNDKIRKKYHPSLLRKIYDVEYCTFEEVVKDISMAFSHPDIEFESSAKFFTYAKHNLNLFKEIHENSDENDIKFFNHNFKILNDIKKVDNFVKVQRVEIFSEKYVKKEYTSTHKKMYKREVNMHDIVKENRVLENLFVPSVCFADNIVSIYLEHDDETRKRSFENLPRMMHFSYLVQKNLVKSNVVYADAHATNVAVKTFKFPHTDACYMKGPNDYFDDRNKLIVRPFMIDYGGISNANDLLTPISQSLDNQRNGFSMFRYVHKKEFTFKELGNTLKYVQTKKGNYSEETPKDVYLSQKNEYRYITTENITTVDLTTAEISLTEPGKKLFFSHGMFTMLLAYLFWNLHHSQEDSFGIRNFKHQYQFLNDEEFKKKIGDDFHEHTPSSKIKNHIDQKFQNSSPEIRNLFKALIDFDVHMNSRRWHFLDEHYTCLPEKLKEALFIR